ncbi:hypothetical protein, partial [Klebsiella pneumoniae]
KRAYCLKTQPATGETYPKSDLFNKAPLMIQFAQKDGDVSEIMFRVGAALAIAEVLARDSGVSKAGTVRRNMNDILRDVFSNR